MALRKLCGQCADDSAAMGHCAHHLHFSRPRSPTSVHSLCGDDGKGGEGRQVLYVDLVRFILCSDLVASPRRMRSDNVRPDITLCHCSGTGVLARRRLAYNESSVFPTRTKDYYQQALLCLGGSPKSKRSASASALPTTRMTTVWMCRWCGSVVALGREQSSEGAAEKNCGSVCEGRGA